MAAHAAMPNIIPYCMSKSATFVLSNGLRRELKSFGVKVATISPWFEYNYFRAVLAANYAYGNFPTLFCVVSTGPILLKLLMQNDMH